MYHAPQGVAAQPSRHARLFELIRQQNLSVMKPRTDVIRVEPKRPAPVKQPEKLEIEFEFEFNAERMLKSASNSLRRAS